jgi:hypothetical protein
MFSFKNSSAKSFLNPMPVLPCMGFIFVASNGGILPIPTSGFSFQVFAITQKIFTSIPKATKKSRPQFADGIFYNLKTK